MHESIHDKWKKKNYKSKYCLSEADWLISGAPNLKLVWKGKRAFFSCSYVHFPTVGSITFICHAIFVTRPSFLLSVLLLGWNKPGKPPHLPGDAAMSDSCTLVPQSQVHIQEPSNRLSWSLKAARSVKSTASKCKRAATQVWWWNTNTLLQGRTFSNVKTFVYTLACSMRPTRVLQSFVSTHQIYDGLVRTHFKYQFSVTSGFP